MRDWYLLYIPSLKNMKKYTIIFVTILIVMGLVGCNSSETFNQDVKQELIDNIKTLEENEYNLYYFKITYDEYIENIKGFVDNSFLEYMDDQIIFGYNGVEYRGSDLRGVTDEQMKKHKEELLPIIKNMGLDNHTVNVQISDVYNSGEESVKYIYTSVTKDFNLEGNLTTIENKRYTLNRIKGKWLITSVDKDKLTCNDDMDPEERESKIANLKYQTIEGQPIECVDNVKFNGFGQ